jgi:hypothetical protein
VTRRSDIDAALQAIYDQVPSIPDCLGKCWVSCGPAEMSDRERQRARQAGYRISAAREAITRVETYWCEALTCEGRCAIYDLRPLICRLWGVTEAMSCPYGCQPDPGYLTDDEGFRLMMESMAVGGGLHDLGRVITLDEVAEAMTRFRGSDAERVFLDRQAGGRRGMALRIAGVAAYDGGLPPAITGRKPTR